MSRSTPRKHQNRGHTSVTHSHSNNRLHPHGHGRNPSLNLQNATSDYESDTAHYMADHPAVPPAVLALRSNTDLNMTVLKRYLPSITDIRSIAPSAVIYVYESDEWKKSTMEGTLFVCSRDSPAPDAGEHVSRNWCLFLLNRKGLQNLAIDLKVVNHIEPSDPILILKFDEPTGEIPMDNGEVARPEVVGIWMHAEDEDDRKENANIIYEKWAEEQEALEKRTQAGFLAPSQVGGGVELGPAAQGTMGRKVSISDLFGARNGHGGA